MTPEHLGAIVRLYDPAPKWENWTGQRVSAQITVGGARLYLSHDGRGKEKVEVRTYTDSSEHGPTAFQQLYFDDAVELMAYLERLRE